MNTQRDAQQGAGVVSGSTHKEKITGAISGFNKSKVEKVDGAWPKAPVSEMSRNHKWKNG
jgi:hypothetical protein